jgi:hypothetical protein
MGMIFTESNIDFDFSAFKFAEKRDTPENQCVGLKTVDFVAEDNNCQFFIEVKNYANRSEDPRVQVNMDKRQKADYLMLTDPMAAFPLEMGMKFKDSLLRCFAAGEKFTKPIALLLIMNPPAAFKARDRERLERRIKGYIPSGMNKRPKQYPEITAIFFNMLTVNEAQKRYGIRCFVKHAGAVETAEKTKLSDLSRGTDRRH